MRSWRNIRDNRSKRSPTIPSGTTSCPVRKRSDTASLTRSLLDHRNRSSRRSPATAEKTGPKAGNTGGRMAKQERRDGHLRCSFCGKSRDEVRKLIAGPTVYICDECVNLCNDIIAEDWEEAKEEIC